MDWRRQGGCRGRSGNHRLDGWEQWRLSVAPREIQGERRRKKSGFFLASRLPLMKVVADSGYVTGRTRVPTGSLPGRSCALADLPHSPAFLPGFAWAPIPLSSVVKFFQNVIPQLREMAKQMNKLTWNVWRLLCSQKGWEAVKTKTEQNAFWQPRILSKRDLKCTEFFFFFFFDWFRVALEHLLALFTGQMISEVTRKISQS